MKRCFFIGLQEMYDSYELKKRIIDELEKIIKSDETIEFWFFRKNTPFIENCLYIALLLKYRYPQKDIKIIRVIDPLRYPPHNSEHQIIDDTDFPCFFIDKIIYAKNPETDFMRVTTNFMRITNNIELWTIKQCNCIIAYYYSIIDYHLDKIFTAATKRSKTNAIHLYFDETEQYIKEEIESLDQRTKDIFYTIQTEKSLVDVAKKFGITSKRISQIAEKAGHIIYKSVKSKKLKRTSQRDRVCCFTLLNENPTIHQLNLFDRFLKYLVQKCGIKEFWIDEKSCNTPYLDVLLNFDNNYLTKPTIKAFMPLDEGKEFDWENFIEKYNQKVLNFIGIHSSDTDIYKEITHKAKYFVTDFTCTESSLIRELCIPDNNVYVFDVSNRVLEVDYQYLCEEG